MSNYKVLLGGSLELEINAWDCAFNYTEHSPDEWYSDIETSVSIDKEEANAIVKALNCYFKLGYTKEHNK